MYIVTIRVSDRHRNSPSVSISQQIVKDYIDGKVCGINFTDQELNTIKFFEKQDLDQLIGSAISRGRMCATSGCSISYYYLGDR